jgi:hypothetical protein
MELLETTTAYKLAVAPSPTSSQHDFDFLEGRWAVYNRKLKLRLTGSNDWAEFESVLHMRKTLLGLGNVENYYATFNGIPFEGMAVRLFNPKTKLWTIHWIDSNNSFMDAHPVTGSFENGVGKFYARDTCNGQDIIMLYQWEAVNPSRPKWSQAFSTDEGKTWEWNWEMYLTKID